MDELELPPALDEHWPEHQIATASGDVTSPLTLGVTRLDATRLFGEARLLQWSAQLRSRGRPLHVLLRRQLAQLEDDPRSEAWQSLRSSLAAVILANASASIVDAEGVDRRREICNVQHAQIRSLGGEVGTGRERALIALDGAALPTFRPFIHADTSPDQVRDRVEQLRRDMGLDAIGPEQLRWVASFAREAIENTYDHATLTLDGAPLDGIRFFQIRRLDVTRQRPVERLLPDGSGPVRDYLDRLSRTDPLAHERVPHVAEITIADCGPGIAARLADDSEVAARPFSEECDLTLRAMRAGESSKAHSVSGRGQGLYNALAAARLLFGLVRVRTGRVELLLDTTRSTPGDPVDWQVTERGWAPGTTISLLLPWWPGAQMQLPLASDGL